MTSGQRGDGRADDAGQITVMLVGFFLVIGLLAAVVIDASAAYLRRQSLGNLADGAALAAADGVQGSQTYAGGLDDSAVIDVAVARRLVGDYLSGTGALTENPGLRWEVSRAGDSVLVRLTAPMTLPLPPPGWDGGTLVAGEAQVLLRVD
ncbi:MAG: pilus assembly protein TadG-related protein [Nocardioidaceae bacterium]